MMEIKLFVCCHQPSKVPKHPLLVPLQVGAALAEEHFPGFFHDDTGDNISDRNRSYCELTGQYWAWKNIEADYYGFFHYRRYLYPDIHAKRPYCIEKEPKLQTLNRYGYEQLPTFIAQNDLILPKGENMHISARDHYARAPFHHCRDLTLIEQIMKDKHPEYAIELERYLSGTICYFGNIFIMKRSVFNNYCNWLFPILEEYDARAITSTYSAQEKRVNGYLAERLLGAYAAAHKSALQIQEWPRLHFEKNNLLRYGQQAIMSILPPGSYRRAKVKQCLIYNTMKKGKYM